VQLREPSGNPASNYVNASFIRDYFNEKEVFIATQGPKRNTVVDFWNMVLEQRVKVVVCLTNPVEKGKVRCYQYWPEPGQQLHFDELTLETSLEVAERGGGDILVRTIDVSKEDNDKPVSLAHPPPVHSVRQFHLVLSETNIRISILKWCSGLSPMGISS